MVLYDTKPCHNIFQLIFKYTNEHSAAFQFIPCSGKLFWVNFLCSEKIFQYHLHVYFLP